jgi:hypothetical protein
MTLNNGNINSQSVTKRAGLVAMVAVTLTIGAAAITVATLTAPTALADQATGTTSCGGNQFPIHDKDGKLVGCSTIHSRPQTLAFQVGRFIN